MISLYNIKMDESQRCFSFKILVNLQCTQALLGGSSVSHRQTLRLSDECPAVAIRLDDPMKLKSLVVLL